MKPKKQKPKVSATVEVLAQLTESIDTLTAGMKTMTERMDGLEQQIQDVSDTQDEEITKLADVIKQSKANNKKLKLMTTDVE